MNRILGPYLNEAGFLLGDGASIERIDEVAKEFGMPMGPLRLIDEVGIDVSAHAGAALHEALGDRLAPSPALVALGGTDRLGKKGGLGFYRYEKGREKGVDDAIYDRARLRHSAGHGIWTRHEIRQRLLISMINEAARAARARAWCAPPRTSISAMIMGTGFPPFRGGLLRFADTHPRARAPRERQASSRPRTATASSPPALLAELAASDRAFYEAFPGGRSMPDPAGHASAGRRASPA